MAADSESPSSRAREPSLGHRVIDLAKTMPGVEDLQLPAQWLEFVAQMIDAGNAAAQSGQSDALRESRFTLRVVAVVAVAVILIAPSIAFGVLLRTQQREVDRNAQAIEALQESAAEAKASREQVAANVKALAGHAMAVADIVNEQAEQDRELLLLIVRELGAEDKIPAEVRKTHEIRVPATLQVVADKK